MAKENLAEMPENYDMMDEVKASAVMNETEEQKIVASNVNDNQEGENPPSPKGGAATKAVEENTVNENARDISQPLTVEDIVKSKQLSPEMLAEIINAAKNDNLFPVDNLDGKELTDKINELHEWVNAEESRLKSIPFSIELYNQKKAVLQARAAYVLILECLIGEKLREIPRQNGTNENSESRASGETRTKSQIIKEEYGLSPRLARDFQHLTWDGVKAAIGLAFKQKDILTNPFYYGEMCIKGEFISHIYPHIVSRSLFDKVQEIFAQNGNHNRNDSENQAKYTYAFRGLIKCKECGGLITPATAIKKNGSKYSHLRCANYKKCCHQAAVMEYVIFEQLEKEVFNKLSLPSNMQEPLKEQILRNLTDTSKLNTTIKINVTKKINELKIKEDKLLDFYLEGKLTQEIYDIKKASIDKEIKGLEDTKEKYKTIDNDTKDKIVKTFTIAGNISYIFQHASPSRQNELLKMLLKDCQLNGKRLEYTLRKPFDTLIKNHNIKEWSNIAIKTIEEIC